MSRVLLGVLSDEERHDQMQQAVNLGLPFLQKSKKLRADAVSICGYGPSLLDTWKTAKTYQKVFHRPLITVSGAHDFLVARGVIPDFHVEIDPRPHKPKMLTRPQRKTQYLMASVCHPEFWDILHGYDVRLWHMVNDRSTVEWVAAHHPAGVTSLIGGGSSAGQRAMNVASWLGFQKFNIFGMDFSYALGKLHADTHTGGIQPRTMATVNGREFFTTKQLLQAAQEMNAFLEDNELDITFHGDGLMQELAREIRKRKQ